MSVCDTFYAHFLHEPQHFGWFFTFATRLPSVTQVSSFKIGGGPNKVQTPLNHE